LRAGVQSSISVLLANFLISDRVSSKLGAFSVLLRPSSLIPAEGLWLRTAELFWRFPAEICLPTATPQPAVIRKLRLFSGFGFSAIADFLLGS